MNGPQHYLAAEKALAEAKDIPTEALEFDRKIQIASIHTQLAHVAVIAPASHGRGEEAWYDAIHQNGGV